MSFIWVARYLTIGWMGGMVFLSLLGIRPSDGQFGVLVFMLGLQTLHAILGVILAIRRDRKERDR